MYNLQYLKPSLQKRQKRRDKRLDEELIECYRRGSRSKQMKGYSNMVKRNNFEHAFQREGMKFKHGGGSKFFNDNLEPMLRLLERRCDRPWNKTFSELNKQLDKSRVSGLHVFKHVSDYVHENVWIESKRIYHYQFGKKSELVSCGTTKNFYVHPTNGLLKKARQVSRDELGRMMNENNPYLIKA
jgi:transposase-like protein